MPSPDSTVRDIQETYRCALCIYLASHFQGQSALQTVGHVLHRVVRCGRKKAHNAVRKATSLHSYLGQKPSHAVVTLWHWGKGQRVAPRCSCTPWHGPRETCTNCNTHSECTESPPELGLLMQQCCCGEQQEPRELCRAPRAPRGSPALLSYVGLRTSGYSVSQSSHPSLGRTIQRKH